MKIEKNEIGLMIIDNEFTIKKNKFDKLTISNCKHFFVETENKVFLITVGNDGFNIEEIKKGFVKYGEERMPKECEPHL